MGLQTDACDTLFTGKPTNSHGPNLWQISINKKVLKHDPSPFLDIKISITIAFLIWNSLATFWRWRLWGEYSSTSGLHNQVRVHFCQSHSISERAALWILLGQGAGNIQVSFYKYRSLMVGLSWAWPVMTDDEIDRLRHQAVGVFTLLWRKQLQ